MLYVGTETGLFVSIDRGGSWTRVKGNLPTVRIDEITLHPRDNAMVLATHGRSLWILDHLEPIQEYAASQKADAALFTPPAAMYRRPARDRNYEFWGDQVFYGQNPPAAVRLTWTQKRQVESVALKITDAAGKAGARDRGPGAEQQQEAGHADGVLGPARRTGVAPANTGGRGGQGAGAGWQAAREPDPVVRAGRARPPARLARDARPAAAASAAAASAAARRRGAVRAAGHLHRRARDRRQDGRHEAAARERGCGGGAHGHRAEEAVRHGHGDPGPAGHRFRGGQCVRAFQHAAERDRQGDRGPHRTSRPTTKTSFERLRQAGRGGGAEVHGAGVRPWWSGRRRSGSRGHPTTW